MARRTPLIADKQDETQGDAVHITQLMDGSGIETAGPEAMAKDSIDMEAFMQEPVTISIADQTGSPGDPADFTVGINQSRFFFIKGQTYTVPRYVVEVMLRAKSASFNQSTPNGAMPDDIRLDKRVSQNYSFGVAIGGDTQKGMEWQKRIANSPI